MNRRYPKLFSILVNAPPCPLTIYAALLEEAFELDWKYALSLVATNGPAAFGVVIEGADTGGLAAIICSIVGVCTNDFISNGKWFLCYKK